MSREPGRDLLDRVDDELQQALDVAPSPEFLARVRERVARETATSHPWMQWLVFAAAGAGTLVFGAWLMQPQSTPRANAVAEWRVERLPLKPPAAAAPPAETRRPAEAPASPRAPVARPAQRALEPEVLVPAGQETLLRRLAEDVRQQRVDPASLFVSSPQTGEPKGIGITPIEVALIGVRPIVEE